MTRNVDSINWLTETIIGCSFRVLNTLGIGFLESVYQNALAYQLQSKGLAVGPAKPDPRLLRRHLGRRVRR